MTKKTNAQLLKELAELKRENEALKSRSTRQRDRHAVIVWPNKDRTNDDQPPWRSTFRIPIPEGFTEGDPLWLDLGLYRYDPETCPYHFDPKGRLPDFTGSVSATDPEFAALKEEQRVEALRKKAQAA